MFSIWCVVWNWFILVFSGGRWLKPIRSGGCWQDSSRSKGMGMGGKRFLHGGEVGGGGVCSGGDLLHGFDTQFGGSKRLYFGLSPCFCEGRMMTDQGSSRFPSDFAFRKGTQWSEGEEGCKRSCNKYYPVLATALYTSSSFTALLGSLRHGLDSCLVWGGGVWSSIGGKDFRFGSSSSLRSGPRNAHNANSLPLGL